MLLYNEVINIKRFVCGRFNARPHCFLFSCRCNIRICFIHYVPHNKNCFPTTVIFKQKQCKDGTFRGSKVDFVALTYNKYVDPQGRMQLLRWLVYIVSQ